MRLISIHAPRVGSDVAAGRVIFPKQEISIHAPRVGSDVRRRSIRQIAKFQSTLPAWGATYDVHRTAQYRGFQSTLPAWGATTVSIIRSMGV